MAGRPGGDPDRGIELLWRQEEEREPRPGLSVGRIVRAAVELADAEGLAGLSMRKVADRLGFTTMSLYRHVPSRDHLVDLMRDEVLAEHADVRRPHDGHDGHDGRTGGGSDGGGDGRVGGGSGGGGGGGGGVGWRERLEGVARQAWAIRQRHPWLAEIRGTRHLPGPNAVAHYDYMLGTLLGTPLTPSEVIAVVGLVGRFVDAEALLLVETQREERRSGVSEEEWWGGRDSLYARLDRYPALSHLWTAGGWDHPEDSFEFGLRRLLDGVEALIRERYESRDETAAGTPREGSEGGRAPETGTQPIAQPGREPSPKSSGREPLAKSGAESGPESGRESSPKPGSEPSPKPGSEPSPKPGSEPSPKPGSEPSPKPGSEPSPKPGSEPSPKPGSEPSPKPGSEPSPKPGLGSGAGGGPESGTGGGPSSGAEPCAECGAALDPAPSGRPRVYCSRACRQRAYRRRHRP
ncbi:TetR/AcrR family transcriptional regulator [Actinomadura luzonensis]|uniref:TetR/AcrR family transcriptional regulator n=1 Tax=Actinomadura luzonensis TaxID=2805427 RepID=UPI0027E29C3A|nr:TetR/AcrR family transcriptional regulator C-terminal domain-containing protein [Actinomadura luzonensis]